MKNAEKDMFMDVSKTICLTFSVDLYHEKITANCALTRDLFQIAMKSFTYDRKRTHHSMISISQLLIKALL